MGELHSFSQLTAAPGRTTSRVRPVLPTVIIYPDVEIVRETHPEIRAFISVLVLTLQQRGEEIVELRQELAALQLGAVRARGSA